MSELSSLFVIHRVIHVGEARRPVFRVVGYLLDPPAALQYLAASAALSTGAGQGRERRK